jgi:hypothetical protein
MRPVHRLLAVIFPLGLAACAVPPPAGPTVMALPGEGKSFEAFQQDDMTCRNYAYQMSGGQQQANAGTDRAVGSAVVGTALGAAAGAALGSIGGQMGAGAAIGGATGLLVGSAAGASGAQASYAGQQQQYDVSYTQCMYSRGDSVQSAPPGIANAGGYPGYVGGYPVYGGGYYAPPVVYGPSVVVGGGWGWGGGWHGGGWNRGWHGDGWHGGGWRGGGWRH